MLIDLAKVLGLPVKFKIYDVESSKFSSNVASIIAKNDFSNVDAVILGLFKVLMLKIRRNCCQNV